MKEVYTKPVVEVEQFLSVDVITTFTEEGYIEF